MILMALFVISFAGCATTDTMVEHKTVIYETPDKKPVQKIDSDAIVVRAKRLTRLEKLKFEAVKINNRQTVEVVTGTLAAITAYAVTDSDIKTGNSGLNTLASLGATAATAYAAGFIAGWIYDIFAEKKP